MNYPNSLFWRGRRTYPEKTIRLDDIMYVRHKPGYDWDESRELPDFSKIKLNQSMNWGAWSLPIWVRFNDKKKYLENYAVVAYLVDNIRNTPSYNLSNFDFSIKTWTIVHKPIEINYSHCELKPNRKLSKKERRAIRLTLKHTANVILKPKESRSLIKSIVDKYTMLYHRCKLKIYTMIKI